MLRNKHERPIKWSAESSLTNDGGDQESAAVMYELILYLLKEIAPRAEGWGQAGKTIANEELA